MCKYCRQSILQESVGKNIVWITLWVLKAQLYLKKDTAVEEMFIYCALPKMLPVYYGLVFGRGRRERRNLYLYLVSCSAKTVNTSAGQVPLRDGLSNHYDEQMSRHTGEQFYSFSTTSVYSQF